MKHDGQTLEGMTLNSLKEHYNSVKDSYVASNCKDTRTHAYLMRVDSWIQIREQQEATE